jgi:hypothetical protein
MSRYPTAWLAAISELSPEKGLALGREMTATYGKPKKSDLRIMMDKYFASEAFKERYNIRPVERPQAEPTVPDVPDVPTPELAIDSHEISAMTTEQLHQLGNMVTDELASREPDEQPWR